METGRKRISYLSGALLVGIMALIFCMSGQTGTDSGNLSGKIVEVLLSLFVRDYSAMDPERQKAVFELVSFAVRKTAHFSEYAALGAAMLLHFHTTGKMRAPVRTGSVLSILYAAGDEFHQSFIPGRAPQVRDVAIDSLGAMAGILICWLLIRKKFKKR